MRVSGIRRAIPLPESRRTVPDTQVGRGPCKGFPNESTSPPSVVYADNVVMNNNRNALLRGRFGGLTPRHVETFWRCIARRKRMETSARTIYHAGSSHVERCRPGTDFRIPSGGLDPVVCGSVVSCIRVHAGAATDARNSLFIKCNSINNNNS